MTIHLIGSRRETLERDGVVLPSPGFADRILRPVDRGALLDALGFTRCDACGDISDCAVQGPKPGMEMCPRCGALIS